MNWWRRLVGGSSERTSRPTDFLAEALDLESRGDYANALTSYRLALRERPDDLGVLQNIAIAFSKTGQPEEAIRTYRRALQLDAEELREVAELVRLGARREAVAREREAVAAARGHGGDGRPRPSRTRPCDGRTA